MDLYGGMKANLSTGKIGNHDKKIGCFLNKCSMSWPLVNGRINIINTTTQKDRNSFISFSGSDRFSSVYT